MSPERTRTSVRKRSSLRADEQLNAEDSYFRHLDDPVLTHEREIELAKKIEHGDKAVLDAVVSSPPALQELAAAAAVLRNQQAPFADFAKPRDAEHHNEKVARDELAEATERAARPASTSVSEHRKARQRVAELLSAYQLSSKVVERILSRLDREGDFEVAKGEPRPDRAAAAIRRGCRTAEAARSELVTSNMRLVVWMARKQMNKGLPLLDLVQEGNIGLMRAADKFDHRRGVRFSTYASWWIRQSLNRALSDQSRVIRMPVYLLDLKHKLVRTRQEFSQQHGREPTPEEAAERTGVSLAHVEEVLRSPHQPLSMEAPLRADGESKLGDVIADNDTVSPIESISRRRMTAQIRRMLATLSPREQQVLSLRFGMGQSEAITLQEIGDQFSLSRERIRQIEQEAISKLRQQAETEELDSYLYG